MINWYANPWDKVAHTLIAMAIFLPFALLGSPVEGTLCAVALLYGREQAQAERKMGRVWQSFIPWLWDWPLEEGKPTPQDARGDLFIPGLIASLVCVLWGLLPAVHF